MRDTKKGIIDISKLNTPPEKHEFEAAKFFADRGLDVVFIPTSNIPKIHTADIIMDGVEWEIKSPTGKSKRTIQNSLRQAVKQSHYIIFDLRRIKLNEEECISQLRKQFDLKKYIKRIVIIKKNLELEEFRRK